MVSLITEKLKQQSLDDAGEPTGWRTSPQRRNSFEQVTFGSGDPHSSVFPYGKPKASPGYGHPYEQMSSPPRHSQGLVGAMAGGYPAEALPGSPPLIPKKRHCRSMSVTEGLPRPIALRPPPVGAGGKLHSHLHSRLYSHAQTRCSLGGRPLQSPYHRPSAFTPTRPALVSPLGGSSDCSSPCSSPVPRPASVSSGYFESSTNSLVETSSLPDLGWSGSPTQRCRSQPTFDAGQALVSATGGGGCGGAAMGGGGIGAAGGGAGGGVTCQLRAGNKRRHRPVSLVWERDTAVAVSGPSTGPACQRKGPVVVVPQWNRAACAAPAPCHQVFYFGSSRSYLVGLPRILSSPSTGECSGHSSTVVDDEDSSAANSGSPESTAAYPSVPCPGPTPNSLGPVPPSLDPTGPQPPGVGGGGALALTGFGLGVGANNNAGGNAVVANRALPVPPGAGGAGGGGGFAAIAEAAEDSGCSDGEEEEDPPQIICSPNLDNVMLFRPVLPSSTIPQFQELDLDQIEND